MNLFKKVNDLGPVLRIIKAGNIVLRFVKKDVNFFFIAGDQFAVNPDLVFFEVSKRSQFRNGSAIYAYPALLDKVFGFPA
jgi:hypothetical protein